MEEVTEDCIMRSFMICTHQVLFRWWKGGWRGGACGTYCKKEKCIQVCGGDTWIEPLGRPRHRCGDNIKMDFTAVGFENVDWIDLVQDRLLW